MRPHSTTPTVYPVLRRAIGFVFTVSLAAAAVGCNQGPSTNVLGGTFTAEGCGVPAEAELYATRVLEMVNEERAVAGLPALSANVVLADLAASYACEMIEGDYFDHVSAITGSTVGSRALQAGYYFQKVGENLAGGQTSAEQVMSEWMASPGHQENILDSDFVEVGIAIRTGGHYGWYWVQEFGLPR